MKYYKSVLNKVNDTNYKKGINRIDESSKIYKTSKVLYILSFVWFMLFHGLYIISNLTVYIGYEASVRNINQPLFITSLIVLVLMVAALVAIKFKWQIATFAFSLIGGVSQIVMIGNVDNFQLANLEHGILANKFFWRHHAPIILLTVFALIMLVIGIVRRVNLRKDYNAALTSMFAKYSEENPGASDADWKAHLEELDQKLSEGK